MVFNSAIFALFLPVVFVLYWFAFQGSIRLRNAFLIAASYVFYGWWDVRFLALIALSSIVDYVAGRFICRHPKLALAMSLTVNLGALAFFKYAGFFVSSFVAAFSSIGIDLHIGTLSIILPVGISFYTFQTLSYTIDIYRGKMQPTKDVFAFFAYVSFFPQLVAGPIERASTFLPQFLTKRTFQYDDAVNGMRQIVWGLFKKMVVADGCASVVDPIFADHGAHSGSTLFIGAVLFGIQIYGDFSGYSDIAIGVARLFGFNLMRNFANPYFAVDIRDFWQRWHISLSTWFRDYVYIPLGGNRGSATRTSLNVLIVFLLSGLWHGANWTFVIWGFYHAVLFLPRFRYGALPTFLMVSLGWIFFRSASVSDAMGYIQVMSTDLVSLPSTMVIIPVLLSLLLMGIEWMRRSRNHALELSDVKSRSVRWFIYLALILAIALLASPAQPFIYFQF